MPIGALAGGWLGRTIGVVPTMWVMAAAGFLSLLPIATPSLLELRTFPAAPAVPEAEPVASIRRVPDGSGEEQRGDDHPGAFVGDQR